MSLRLYCNRYGHFKAVLVCAVNCVYRTRCQDFALFYDEHRAETEALVGDYYDARREPPAIRAPTPTVPGRVLPVLPNNPVATPTELRTLIRLEVKKEMAEAMYIWIDKEDRAELLETEEVIRRAERGSKAKNIYKVSQEMELRFQLVPRKRIEKFKRAADAEAARAQARRTRSVSRGNANAPVPFPTPAPVEEAPVESAPRRARARTVKAVGGRS